MKDDFSSKWVSRMPFFTDVFRRDKFLLNFWNLRFFRVEDRTRDHKIHRLEEYIGKCQTYIG